MNTFVMFLRGINVGGNHIIKMPELVGILNELGLEKINTYIQSGNVVGHSSSSPTPELCRMVSEAIFDARGFKPDVVMYSIEKLKSIMSASPYRSEGYNEQFTHIFFLLEATTQPDLDLLQSLQSETEEFKLTDDAFYVYAPDGIGRSKLVAKASQALGVATTARNWRTTNKVLDMALALT